MAKQPIDIGSQGNDGTGDSIREAFRKVNENFNELYAVFGAGGSIKFTDLADTPKQLYAHQLLITNDLQDGTADLVEARSLIAGAGIELTYGTDNGLPALTIASTATNITADESPKFGGPINVNGFLIGNAGEVTDLKLQQFNSVHGTSITADDLLINKKFADKRYIQQTGGGSTAGTIRIRSEPSNASGYIKTINAFNSGNLVLTAHGYDSGSDGIAFVYASTGAAASNLTRGQTYYLKYVNVNQLSVHPTLIDAKNGTNKIVAGLTDGGTGTQTLTDAYYNPSLSGYFLSNEALPRESVVRRQGDTMTGALILNDHPGTLSGAGTPNGADDLQAATKYYVDNSSFASQVNLFVTTTGDDAQANTPSGKEGRAFAYAYKTVGAACVKAAELIDLAGLEPGPYRQKITYTIGSVTYNSSITAVGFVSGTGYTGVQSTIAANREYIREEVVSWIDYQIANNISPFSSNFAYKRDICSRDIGIILDAIVLDVLVGGNYQSINAGKAYYRNASALVASSAQQLETVAGIAYAKTITNLILQGQNVPTSYQSIYTRQAVSGTVTSSARSAVAAAFDIVTGVISNGPSSAPTRNFGSGTVSITFNNGNVGYVDQGNPSNIDIIAGKLIKGVSSGAIAKIVKYTSGSTADTITGYLLTPINFLASEQLEFAEPNRELQITIRIESGVYYEDLPIKIPANVTVKGDEFRRTIIRPRDRASQAPLVQSYFYRDKYYDGLRLTAYISSSQATATTVTPNIISGVSTITLGSGNVSTGWFGAFFKANQGAGVTPAEGVVTSVFLGAYNSGTLYYPGQIISYSGVYYKVQGICKGLTPPNSTFYAVYNGSVTSLNVMEVTLFSPFQTTSTVASGSWYIYQTTNYGYHYLQDPSRVMDVGSNYVNIGKFVKSAKLLEINRSYIQAEIAGYLLTTQPTIWNGLGTTNQDKCTRDVGFIIDAIVSDLRTGGKASSVDAAARYYGGAIPSNETTATVAAINYINTLAQKIILNLPPTTSYQSTVTRVSNGVNGESSSAGVITNLVGTVAYAFDANYNPPKNNKEIDMFLMNDAVKIHNVTGQGHGGFMCVLDPNGLVGSKSPYVQSCSSLTGSINKQRFAGGQFIDGFVGRLPCTITNVTNGGLTLTVSGLTKREPIGPTAFYNAGFRYQIDNVSSWNSSTGVATLDVNGTTPWSGGNIDIILETPGNRSMLANDFTQVNDLGYGVVAHNTGLTEQVSTFTYYCHTAYMASNGGQIRSVAGSNAHGNYGLRAVGSDPTEAPDQVYLQNNLAQVAQVYKAATVANVGNSGEIQLYIKRYDYIPTATSELEINTTTGPVRYEVRGAETTGLYDNLYSLRVTGVTKATTAVVTLPSSKTITGATQANPVVITAATHGLADGDEVKITGIAGMTQLNNRTYYVKVTGFSASTFGLYLDTALTSAVNGVAYTAYSSGGTLTVVNPLHNGDRVTFANVGGMTQLNGNNYYVKTLTQNTFSLYSDKALTTPINSTGFTTYTSGGTVTDQIYYTISAATKESPCTVTVTAAHSFNNGDVVFIANVLGMTDINAKFYVKVSGVSSTQVKLYSDSTLITPVDSTTFGTYTSGGTIVGGQEVLKINLSTAANDNRVSTGLSETLYDDQMIIIRALQNFKVYDVANVNPTRPSTALEFADTITNITGGELYRVIAYNLTETTGAPLPSSVAVLTVDTSFLFVRPLVKASSITTVDPIDNTKRMGSQVGDTRIAIDPSSLSLDGIRACNSNKWVFGWEGKLHKIVSYTAANGAVPAYITIADVSDLNNISTATGIAAVFSTSTSVTLRAGLPAGSQGQVTVKISTCRATGHDFLDIGTGGYNTTNYPYAIFGNPAKVAVRENQVKEETKGRVFYVATDQDGIFTVGRFFKVDQGTGTVTFSASIALSNLDGLGFKRGVVVSEFSTDNSMTNNASDTVATQSAVRGYIDRRLGLTHVGTPTALLDLIGPGFLPLNGSLAMKSSLNMGGNKITSLASPTDATDAVNLTYVTSLINSNNQLVYLKDTAVTAPTSASVLMFTGSNNANIDATITGDVSGTISGSTKAVLAGGITSAPTIDNGIISTLQGAVSGGIVVDNISGFPSSGYLIIDGEIFYYAGTTVISNRFDSVVRAQYTTSGAIHSAGADVIALSSAQLNLQLNAGVVVDADINAGAAIAQSKLAMNSATTRGNATGILQSEKGLASFDSAYFSANNGWITLSNTSIGLGKLSSIGTGTVLANLSGSSASPSATAASDVFKAGLDQSFSSSGVVTFTVGTPNTYATTPVSTNNDGNSIVKTDSSGQINVTSLLLNGNTIVGYSGSNLNIRTPGGFKIIDAVGATEAATTVTLNGQFTLGTSSTFNATTANNATNATNADKLNVSGNYRSAAIAATANTIAARDASGNLTAAVFTGNLSGLASNATYATSAGTAGNTNYADNLKVFASSATAVTGVSINGTSGQFTSTVNSFSVGQSITVSGTFGGTGTIVGYTNPTTYYVIATNGSSTFALSATYSPTTTVALSGVSILTTNGQFSCNATALSVGQPVCITGTLGGSGSITSYASGNIYYIISTNGSTQFTLSSSYNGTAIATTVGTPTGLTYTLTPTTVVPVTTTVGTPTGVTYTISQSTPSYRIGNEGAVANTIAARTSTDYTDPGTGVTYTAGSLYANYFVGIATSALFADLAEFYLSDKKYDPGTVVVFGGDKEITVTMLFGDSRVAGIVSTNPAYIMNSEIQGDGEKVCVALQGRVPCKVVGMIKKGDLLTTSAIPGHAVRAMDPKLGTIIGKALQDKTTSEAGVIEVSVGRT